MLEYEQNTVVVISNSEFRNFVQDDWDWSDNFKMSNMKYGSGKI